MWFSEFSCKNSTRDEDHIFILWNINSKAQGRNIFFLSVHVFVDDVSNSPFKTMYDFNPQKIIFFLWLFVIRNFIGWASIVIVAYFQFYSCFSLQKNRRNYDFYFKGALNVYFSILFAHWGSSHKKLYVLLIVFWFYYLRTLKQLKFYTMFQKLFLYFSISCIFSNNEKFSFYLSMGFLLKI